MDLPWVFHKAGGGECLLHSLALQSSEELPLAQGFPMSNAL